MDGRFLVFKRLCTNGKTWTQGLAEHGSNLIVPSHQYRYVHSQCLEKVYQISLSPYYEYDYRRRRLQVPPPEANTNVTGVFNPGVGVHTYHQHVNHMQVWLPRSTSSCGFS
jgi:hypothetical protein